MRWFGEHWGAPVCDECERCSVPVGESCLQCGKPIAATDSGFETPLVTGTPRAPAVSNCYWHLTCMLDHVVPKHVQEEIQRCRDRV